MIQASGGQLNTTQSTETGEFDATQSEAYPRSPDYQGSSSGQLTSNVGLGGVQVAATLNADCVNPYDSDGASAQGRGFVFQVTAATSVRIQGSVSVTGTYSGSGSGAAVALSKGTWTGSVLANSFPILNHGWMPGSSYIGDWSPGTAFDETVALAPGYYEFFWSASLSEGVGNPLAGITGSGALQFSTTLTLPPNPASVPAASPITGAALGLLLAGSGGSGCHDGAPTVRLAIATAVR